MKPHLTLKKQLIILLVISGVLMSFMSTLSASALTQSEMINKINEKYKANTWLGNSLTQYTIINGGMFVHYQNGSIYIGNNAATACVVTGMIRDKWSSMGWEKSFLGFPLTDELKTPDGIGRFNHFEGGSIYWYPGAGAHEIHGLIRNKWASLNWEKGSMGYPISDELVSSDGTGRYTIFQKGRIYYHPTYGTHYIAYGKFYLNWADKGCETGSYPISDPFFKNGIYQQNFSKGSLSNMDTTYNTGVDLRGEINRRGIGVRTQGSRQICVEEAMVFLQEYALTGLCGKEFNHLSIDYAIQAGNRAINEDWEASSFPKMVAGYNKYGTIVNSSWPYNVNDVFNFSIWNKKMTSTLISNGQFMLRKGLKLSGRFIKQDGLLLTANQFADIKNCLDSGIPVAEAYGGHAMVIVGYVDDAHESGGGHFILRNSWGPYWDDDGYCTLTYKEFKSVYPEIYVYEGIAK